MKLAIRLPFAAVKAAFVLVALAAAACSTDPADLAPDAVREQVRGDGLSGTAELAGIGACAGILVTATGPEGISTTTSGPDGSFAVTGLVPGAYAVSVSAPDHDAFEEVVVYDGQSKHALGTIELAMATVPVAGEVALSDGETPAGTSVQVTGEVELEAPEGIDCSGTDGFAPGLTEAFDGSAVVGDDGRYTTRVPRRARDARGEIRRPGYTREGFDVDSGELAAASDDSPVDVGARTLYPLTGFVNAVGGAIQSDPVVTLQVSAFNGAGELALGVTEAGGSCSYGPWRTFAAEVTVDAGADGAKTICAAVRNDRGQTLRGLTADVEVDTTPPSAPVVVIGSGAAVVGNPTQNVSVASEEAGTGLDRLRTWQAADQSDLGERLYAPIFSHTLGGDGIHTLRVQAVDAAGNASPSGMATVTVDTAAPTYTVAFHDRDGSVTAVVEAADATPVEVRLGYQGPVVRSLADAAWQPLSTTGPATVGLDLPPVDGSYQVRIQLRDAAGNLSAIQTSPVVELDTTAPAGTSFAILGGETVTSPVLDVQLTAVEPGLTVELSEDVGFADPVEFAYVAATTYALADTSAGYHVLYARFCDAAGNCAGPYSDAVILDATPPSAPAIAVREGSHTNDDGITLDLFANGADRVKLAQGADPDFGAVSWQAYAPEVALSLSGGDGSKTVHALFGDLAGNTAGPVSATVELDTAAPVAGAEPVAIDGGAATTTDRDVELALDVTGATEVRVSESPAFAGASWQAVTDAVAFTLSAGDGSKTVYAEFRDAAGNTAGPFDAVIELDATAPAGASLTIQSADPASSTVLSLSLAASGADTVELSESGSFTAPTAFPYQAATTHTLVDGADGVRFLYARFCDAAGNCSAAVADSVTLDRTAPTGSLSIDGGADYTRDATVDLALSANGADEMRLGEGPALAGAAWTAYSTAYAFDVTTGQGAKTVYAQFRDAAGNRSAAASATIVYDGNAPAAGTGITLAGGAAFATDPLVTVFLDVPADASEMQVANNAGFAGSVWQSTAPTVAWELTSGDGSKTVYARWRDAAGNETGILSDDLVLDTEPPVLGSPAILLDGGAAHTAAATAAVSLDAAGAVHMQIDDDENFASPEWDTGYATVTTVTLPAGDGTATFYARFRDAAGNWTDARSDGIAVDRTAPELGEATVNGGAAWSQGPEVDVQVFAYDDSPLTGVEVSEDGFGTVDARPFTPGFPYHLAAAEGVSTAVAVRVVDAAGNRSAPVTSQALTWDATPPVPGTPAIRINDGAAWTDDRLVELTLAPGDASELILANNPAFSGAAWQPATASASWTLGQGDGLKRVYVAFRDAAGNVTGPVDDAIGLDTTPPALDSFAIAEMPVTSAATWTVNHTASGDVAYFDLREEGSFEGGVTYPPAPATEHTLADQAEGDHTLFLRACDAVGNCTDFQQRSRELDTEAPTVAQLAIDNGAAKTADPAGTVALQLFAADSTGGSGIVGVRLGNSKAAAMAAAPVPYEGTKAWTLAGPLGDGVDVAKTVWAIYHDAANNRSTPVSATIRYDRLAPTGTIAFPHPLTNQTLVPLDLSYAPDAEDMKLSQGGACAGGSWVGVTTATLWNLSAVEGPQQASVRYRDDAGNTGPCYAATATRDTAGPVPDGLALTGNPGAEAGYTKTDALSLDADTAAGDCDGFQIAEDVGFIAPTDGGAGSCTLTGYGYGLATTADGTRTVYLRYVDGLGNWGPVTSAAIELDTQPPLVSGGGFTVEQGSHTNDPDLDLTMNVQGADEMMALEGSACGGTIVPYADTAALTISPFQGGRDVTVCFRDFADNRVGPYTRTVTLDTIIDGGAAWYLAVTGSTGQTGFGAKTAAVGITAVLVGVDADVTEMRVSNLANFGDASWVAFDSHFPWNLPSGDGGKTVYVQIRDAAGNTDQDQVSIELDTTAPDPPSLQLFDTSGDGFALSDEHTELQWNQPTGTDHYELQRYIAGVDGAFVTIEPNLAAIVTTYDDNALEPGNTHQYRIRAIDGLGNTSGWSTVAAAYPYSPITEVAWIAKGDQYHYDFPPEPGTFSLQPSYVYSDIDGNESTEGLVTDQPDWTRPDPAAGVVEETLVLRTSNQDNSLVFDSTFSLGINVRQVLDDSTRAGQYLDFAAGPDGTRHVAYYQVCNLKYGNDAGGSWSIQVADQTGDCVGTFTAIAVDRRGGVHMAFRDGSNKSLRYSSNVIRVLEDDFESGFVGSIWEFWSAGAEINGIGVAEPSEGNALNLDGGGDIVRSVDLSGNGPMTYSYFYQPGGGGEPPDQVQAADRLRFEVNDGSGWVTMHTHAPDDAPATAFTLVYGELPEGTQRVRFRSDGCCEGSDDWFVDDVRIEAVGSGFQDVLVDDGGGNDTAWYTGMAVDEAHRAHIAYYDNTVDTIRYATNLTSAWSAETVSAVSFNAYPDVAAKAPGKAHIVYYDGTRSDLMYANNLTGGWGFEAVAANHLYPDIVLDDSGKLHLAVQGTGSSLVYGTRPPGGPWGLYTVTSHTQSVWQPQLALDAAGAVHISTHDTAEDDLLYSTNATGGWSTHVIDAVGNLGSAHGIAVGSGGTAHFGYYDGSNEYLKYASYSAAGQVPWARETIHAGGDRGAYADAALDGQGNVHIAYRNANASALMYATNASGGTWTYETVDDPANLVGYFPAITVAGDGTVHITHYDGTADDLLYVSGQLGAWSPSQILAGAGNVGTYNDVGVDPAGTVHVVYADSTNDDLRYLVNDGSGWTGPVIADGANRAGEHVDLTIDPADHSVHLAYYRICSLVYANNVGGSWSQETADQTGNCVGQHPGIGVDGNGAAHISYYDASDGVLRFTSNASGSWVDTLVDPSSDSGKYSDLAMRPDGTVGIAYWRNDTLRYATNGGGFWQTTTLDNSIRVAGSFGGIGLVIDAEGEVHIAYYDDTDDDLEFFSGEIQGVLPAQSVEQTTAF